MRRAPSWLRNSVQRTRQVLALVLTALLLWCSVSRAASITPRGVQCPTAAVQTVLVARRDCCDRIVGYEVRTPKIGERGFLQCRCAEKKAAQHGAATPPAPRADVAISVGSPVAFDVPARLPEAMAEDTYRAVLTSLPVPPNLRPPTFA